MSADIPEPQDKRLKAIANGVYYLLSDRQVKVGEEAYVYYQRTALKIINRSGLEDASRLQFVIDPVDDRFTVHHVRVIRDGAVIDRFDASALQLLRRENDLANGITNGNLTAYYEIPDVRVGDILDYATSWETRSELWPGEYSNTLSMRWSVPLEHQRIRVLIDKDRMLNVLYRNLDAEPAVTTADGMRDYVWEETDLPVIPGESAMPLRYPHWGEISLSTFSGWEAVVESLAPAYEDRMALPEDFIARESWLRDNNSSNDKITAAIRFVQDQIRYVGDETGVGSHLPRSPAEVLERGWGDCKDKALLLTAILRQMGVNAYAALTDMDNGYALPQIAPSPYAFDHVIVAIDHDGMRRWIDATSYDQGGVFPDIHQPSYGYGLLLKDGETSLAEIQPGPAEAPQKILTETFEMKGFQESGLALTVVTEYLGGEADNFRRLLGSNALSKLEQDYFKYYRERYSGLDLDGSLNVEDDRDANRIVSRETYALDRSEYAGTETETNFPMRADAVLGLISAINFDNRTAPISLPYPVNNKHVITLKNIGDFTGLANVEKSTDYFEYSRIDKKSGRDVTFTYHFRTLAPEAPADAGETYSDVTKDLDDWGYFEYQPGGGGGLESLDSESIAYIALFLLLVAAVIYLPFGIVFTFKKDNLKMADAVMHPTALGKFIFLTFFTLGLYAVFWMWRNWRWLKKQEAAQILPFWRAFFSVIWFYPLFGEIREHQEEDKQAPSYLGVLLAIAYAAASIISTIIDKAAGENVTALLVSTAMGLLGLGAVFPLVHWVNGLNRNNPQAIAANSRWSGHTIGALFIGLVIWGLVLLGVFLPE